MKDIRLEIAVPETPDTAVLELKGRAPTILVRVRAAAASFPLDDRIKADGRTICGEPP